MIKKHLKTLIITSIIVILPVFVGLYLWNQLPEQIPTHWNAAGEIDGWSNKAFAVFGLPGIMLAAQWLCVLGTAADPKKANHADKVLHLVLWIIPLLTVVLLTITYATALGKEIPIQYVMPVLIGLILTIIGNYLPKCKQNYTIGIKIPWTLNSEENWNRTHRFAGRLWVVCGILIVLSGLLNILWVMVAMFFLMVFLPIIYSFVLHKKGV